MSKVGHQCEALKNLPAILPGPGLHSIISTEPFCSMSPKACLMPRAGEGVALDRSRTYTVLFQEDTLLLVPLLMGPERMWVPYLCLQSKFQGPCYPVLP